MTRMNIRETRPDLGFDEDVARETYRNYLQHASPTIFVAEKCGEIVGYLIAEMYSYRVSTGLFTTQEVLFVKPAHRGTRAAAMLMKQLIVWSRELGAKEIIGGNDNSFRSDRTARFLEHFGFERVGIAMRRVL